jgi:hypothetical protein
MFCISEPNNFNNYIQKVKEYVHDVFGKPSVPHELTAKIRDAICSFNG